MNNLLASRDSFAIFDKDENLTQNGYVEIDYLALGRGLETQEYVSQRFTQIATILQNLSFIDENLVTLTNNRGFIRFFILLSNVR